MFKIIYIVLSTLVGILTGTFTGLSPGIHVNTVGAIVFSISAILLGIFSVEVVCVFLVSMSIAHAMLEFVPSMLLGVPDETTALSVLPGHKLVLEGRASEAIRIVSVAGFGAILLTILLLPLFTIFLPTVQSISRPFTWIILLIVSIYMLVRLSRNFKSFIFSTILFSLSGLLGWVMLGTNISSNLSLMSMFSGLFGISTIFFSLNDNSFIPYQNPFFDFELNRDILKGIFAGGTAGCILGFLPGFGPAQGSILAQEIGGSSAENDCESFLASMSGVNTSDTLFSLVALYLIGNPRSGIAVYIIKLLGELTMNHLFLFIFVSLFAVSISLILCLKIGDRFSSMIKGLNYRKLSISVIILIIIILYVFIIVYKGPILYLTLTLITSTALGLLPHYLGVSKSHLMGVLIIPALIIYLNMFN